MSDPREPSDTESAAPDAAPSSPSTPPFPSGSPSEAPSEAPSTPSTPPFVPPTAPLAPASSSLPPIQKPPAAPSAPSYGPPSTSGSPSPASSYGAPPVYGTPPSTSSSAPTPVYGSKPTPAGAPPSGQLPYTAPYAPGTVPPSGKGGWMGIVSLILGGLALVVSWVPFLDVVTVFGAIGGLVIGLIALLRKLGSRALSLAGTIVSGIAFVVSVVFIVFYAVTFFSAIDSASDYDDSPSTSKPYSDPSRTDAPEDSTFPGDPTPVPGDPATSAGATVCTDGTAIELGKAGIFTLDGENQAEVTINSVKIDATDEILAENSFNDAPPEGYQYALVSFTVKQLSLDSFDASAVRALFKGVPDDVARPAQYMVVPKPAMLFSPDLHRGESVTGNIAALVPASGAESGSLLVKNYEVDNVCEMKVG